MTSLAFIERLDYRVAVRRVDAQQIQQYESDRAAFLGGLALDAPPQVVGDVLEAVFSHGSLRLASRDPHIAHTSHAQVAS